MGPTWVPPGSCRPRMGPMLAPWTLLSGIFSLHISTQTERQGCTRIKPWMATICFCFWIYHRDCVYKCQMSSCVLAEYIIYLISTEETGFRIVFQIQMLYLWGQVQPGVVRSHNALGSLIQRMSAKVLHVLYGSVPRWSWIQTCQTIFKTFKNVFFFFSSVFKY